MSHWGTFKAELGFAPPVIRTLLYSYKEFLVVETGKENWRTECSDWREE